MEKSQRLPHISSITIVSNPQQFQHLEVNLPNFTDAFRQASVNYAGLVLGRLKDNPEYRLDGEDLDFMVDMFEQFVFDSLYATASYLGLPEDLVLGKETVLSGGLFVTCYVTPKLSLLTVVIGCTTMHTAIGIELRNSFLVKPNALSTLN